ncbi:MAG: DUF2357 domain-containing protein [Archangium sp.]|nr:DUF2357 domain-containing protein [Archangium sp.]
MLRVRRGSDDTVLSPFPKPNPGFRELGEVTFLRPQGGPWSLVIDDLRLEEEGPGWRWTPDFFAGPVVAVLQGPTGETRWVLDVSPDPSKLGREQFNAMLAELIAMEPLLVPGVESATSPIAYGSLELEDELAALLALSRLRTWGDRLLRATEVLERQPRRVLRRRTEAVALHRARRVSDDSLHRLLRSQQVRRANEISRLKVAFDPKATLDVHLVEPHVDSPANRVVIEYLHAVARRITATEATLSRWAQSQCEDRGAQVARLRHDVRREFLEGLKRKVTTRLRAWPWREVMRHPSSAAGMNAISADPSYAHFGAMAWACLRTGLRMDGGEETLSLSPTWQIFERWCFARIARQLRERRPELAWSRETSQGALVAWVGRSTDTEVRFLLQPRFAAWDQSQKHAFRSLSREREPDFVLISRCGDQERWLVLDAKYRVARSNVLEAMESAHIYRDSLRVHGAPPVASFLLVPAEPGARWLHDGKFQSEHGTGALVFCGQLDEPILQLLGMGW